MSEGRIKLIQEYGPEIVMNCYRDWETKNMTNCKTVFFANLKEKEEEVVTELL